MAHGPDTEKLLQLIEQQKNGNIINVAGLQITSLPILPQHITSLYCGSTQIKELPAYLNLKQLNCFRTDVTEIPPYPDLEELNCVGTKVKEIPMFKKLKLLSFTETAVSKIKEYPVLHQLICSNTQVKEIPHLPLLYFLSVDKSIERIAPLPCLYQVSWHSENNHVLQKGKESNQEYIQRLQESETIKRIINRNQQIKEELMIVTHSSKKLIFLKLI